MFRVTRSLRPLLMLAALAALSGAAQAATLTVDTDQDVGALDGVCSLREAILAANTDIAYNDCPAGDGPDRIAFALATPAEIDLVADLPAITETLLIRGPGALQLAVDGGDLHRLLVFDTAAGGDWLGVERLALFRGRSPGGANGDGGGAYVGLGENAWFSRVLFAANRSANGGGGLAVEGGGSPATSVTVVECFFDGNAAEGPAGGGGLALLGTGGGVTVIRSTFFDNRAEHENGSGGAIFAARGDLRLESSTVSGNQANDDGGGVHLLVTGPGELAGSLTVLDSTVTDNLADADGNLDGDGGGIDFSVGSDDEATLELRNTVVADNLATAPAIHPHLGCETADLAASGAAFIGSNAGCETLFPAGAPNAAGDYVGTAAAPLDPELGPLADNGGPLPTHAPVVPLTGGGGSPLVDQGSCPNALKDQRGFGDPAAGRRVVDLTVPNPPGGDGCDIGAVELDADPGVDRTLFADGFEAGHTLLWTSEVLVGF